MFEKSYFPFVEVTKKGDGFEAVCGFKLVSLKAAHLMANAAQVAYQEPWQNPVHPLRLHDARVAFLEALSEWPEQTTLELHLTAQPDLGHMPKGNVSITIGIRCFGETRACASEAVVSHFLQLKALLAAHFSEGEFSPIRDAKELKDKLCPFDATHALAVKRRREVVSLAKAFDVRETGFHASLRSTHNKDYEVTHIFPWVPSNSDWRTLMDFFLWQIDPVCLLVRIRPRGNADNYKASLSQTVEMCEAFLTKSEACKTVLTLKAEKLRDLSLERLVEIHNAALRVGIFILARHPIDSAVASVLGQSITQGYDRDHKRGLLRGGFVSNPIAVREALDSHFFPEAEPYTPQEAACAFRLPAPPVGGLSGVTIKRTRTAFASFPKDYIGEHGLIKLGTNRHRGVEQAVVLSLDDRMRHFFILGQTGTGKSSLMESMVLQDIRTGRGLCLIDPHGELLESVLGKIPDERTDDVIVFCPMDSERPVGFNLLEWKTIEERDFLVDELYLTMDRLYDMRQAGGPIFESNFRGMLKLLMGDKKRCGFVPTVLEFPILYIDKGFRKWLKETTGDPQVHDFIKELERTGGDASLDNLAPYVTSKFSRFVNDIRLRRIIGQEHTPFDFREIMDEGKILLVNLGKGRFGESVSGLLASQIVSRFKAAAMSRADQAEAERKDFFLYVDEFNSVPKENFGQLLSEARKYRLGLVLATQYADQLKGASGWRDDLLPSVLGNVGNIVVFRLGIKDAEKLAPVFYPVFDKKDLTELPNWNAYARLQADGSFLQAFNFQANKDITTHDPELAARIRTLSRLRYGKEANIVDAKIAKRRNCWRS